MKKKLNFLTTFKKYMPIFGIAMILLLGSVTLIVLSPSFIQALTNDLQNMVYVKFNIPPKPGMTLDSVMHDVFTHAITLMCIVIGYFVLAFTSAFLINTAIQKYSRDIRNDISVKINKLPLNYFDTRQIGDILSIVTNDVDSFAQSLQNSCQTLIQAVFQLIGVIIAMFIAEWHMAIVVLISLPIMLILAIVAFKFATPLYKKNQEMLGEVNAIVEEDVSGQIVTKVFNAADRKIKSFKEQNGAFGKNLYKSQAIGGLIEPLMTFVSYLTYTAILIAAALLVQSKVISDLGLITGFIIYVSLFQSPLSELGQVSSQLQLGVASSKRVFEFLNEGELPNESSKPRFFDGKKIIGAVEFKDVSFGYDTKKLTIKNFNQSIKPGMKVAIIGPTGAGKTTLVNLLMRFYETTSGDITVDGVSIHDMSFEELRSIFGMILQETWVINGSVRENIVYNIKDVDENRLKEILEQTNLSHFVETLPEGIDTVIQKESALSAGQKQLITIARAMVENSPMIILDEATSNVDTRTEILIQNAMDSLTKGRTSFVIAHRLSTIKNADLILVMKDGNVVETGTHDTLMKLKGLYCEIYNSQFAK